MEKFNRKETIAKFEKAEKVIGELGESKKERRDIISDRFGGENIFLAYATFQLFLAFKKDKNLSDAYNNCTSKIDVVAMIGACIEIGYTIAEERYGSMVKMLEDKLVIAKEELKKEKGEYNG